MKHWKQTTKRYIAMLLALVMTFSLAQNGLIGLVRAQENEPSASGQAGNKIVREVLADMIDGTEGKILEHPALKSDNRTFNVTAIEKDAAKIIDGNKLTAQAIDGWEPVSYAIDNGTAVPFNGAYEVVLPEDYSSVTVNYKQTLTWDAMGITEADALEIVNLPYTLKTESSNQLEAMESLAAQKQNLTLVQSLLVLAETYLTTAEGKEALANIKAECLDDEGKIKLLKTVNAYPEETDAEKLKYYYESNKDQSLNKQLKILAENLDPLAKDEGLNNWLKDMGWDGKFDLSKVTEAAETLKEIDGKLTQPNKYLDLDSENLNDLLTLITVNELTEKTSVQQPVLQKSCTINAPGKVNVTVTVEFKSSTGLKDWDKSESFTVLEGSEQTSENLEKVNRLKVNLLQNLLAYTGLEKDCLIENESVDNETKEYKWTYSPKSFEVRFVDSGNSENVISTKTVYLDNLKVTLPTAEQGKRYEFYFNGTRFNGEFTLADVKTCAPVTIEFKLFDVSREEVEQAIEDVNNALSNSGVSLRAYDVDGSLTVALCLDVQNLNMNAVNKEELGEALLMLANLGVMYNGQSILEGMSLNPQNLLDAILTSGIGMDSLLSAVNPDGTINQTQVNGADVGGLLGQMDLTMGGVPVSFLITLGGNSFSQDVRKNVADVSTYLNVNLKDGVIAAEVKNVPERAYQAAVVAMLALGEADLKDLSSIELANVAKTVYELIVPVIHNESVDSDTLIETLKALKINTENLDLSFYDKIVPTLRKLMPENAKNFGETKGDTFCLTLGCDLQKIINKLGLSEADKNTVNTLLAENEVKAPIEVTIEHLNKTFTALVIDPKASGADILRFYSDAASLQTALDNRNYTSLVVLLSDVEGNLTITGRGVVLDLNGYTITGDLTANATTVVVNSNMTKDGGVTGTVSGNVKLTTGVYSHNVTAFLPAGYVQNDGKVENKYFDMVQDANGNYTVTIKLENALAETKVPSVKALALEAAYTFALNQYQAAAWSFGRDMEIYALGYDDLVELLDGISTADGEKIISCLKVEGIQNFLNDFLANVTDFKGMAKDGVVAEYNVSTAPWRLSLTENGDRLAVGITSGEPKTSKLTIQVEMTDSVKELLAELAKVAEIDVTVDLDKITVNGTTVSAGGSVEAAVNIDMSGNSNYGLVAAIMAANQMSGERQKTLVAAINTAIRTGKMDALKTAMDEVTQAELVNALKTTKRGQFRNIISGLNITNKDSVIKLEETFDDVLFLAGQLFNALDINGGKATLQAYDKGYSEYKFSAAPQRTASINAAGLTFELTGNVKADVTIKLFAKDSSTVNPGPGPVNPTNPTDPSTEPTTNPTDPSTEPTTNPTEPTTEPTDPTTNPTEPTTEPTDPTTNPTEPTTEPTEPTTKPTEPSSTPTAPVEPEEPTGNGTAVWIIIAVVIGVAAIAAVALYFVKKKKNQKDNTPLVDYDISDDE